MEAENLNRPTRSHSDFDLKRFLLKYLRYWYIFAISIVLGLVIAKYVNWYANPVFGITARLLVKDNNAGKDMLLEQLNVEKPAKNIENEIEIIRSHNLMAKTLNELDFDVSYFLVGNVKISEVYKDCPFRVSINQVNYQAYSQDFNVDIIDDSSFRYYFTVNDEEKSFTAKFEELLDFGMGEIVISKRENFPAVELNNPLYKKRQYLISFNTIAANQNKYLSRLSVQLARSQSTILQLYLEDEVPQKGLDFVNKLIEVYLSNDVDIKNAAASATATFLDEQLGAITDDLERIETNRENYKVSKGIIDLESESQLVLESIKDIDAQLAINNTRISMIKQLERYIVENQYLRNLAPAALDIDDPLLIKLINKLSELQSQREIILNKGTSSAPALVPINAEIELTRSSLLENIRNIQKSLEYNAVELENQLGRYKNRVEKIPTTERELLGIERKFRIQESLYVFLLKKRAELAISLAATESDTRIVDNARVFGPISPVPQRAYSIALLLSILIPLALILLVDKLNDKVSDIATIRRMTHLSILGVVRFNKYKSTLVAIDKPQSSIAEEYRNIRTNLKFFQRDDDAAVTMITSSVGTEGKTFSAMNLASVMAASGAKVVLVGLDMRKPRIVEDFNISNKIGCSNYLSGNASLDEVIVPSGMVESLFILPSGPTPPNPSELVMGPRMEELINELKAKFDRIVIDTPPIGLVSDGLVISNFADSVLFVVRDGVTRKSHLADVEELYNQKKLKNLAVIFNAVKRRNTGYGYNSGYGYGYGAQYGSYFEDEADNKGFFAKWKQRLKGND